MSKLDAQTALHTIYKTDQADALVKKFRDWLDNEGWGLTPFDEMIAAVKSAYKFAGNVRGFYGQAPEEILTNEEAQK